MIDIFADDIEVREIRTIKEGQQVMFSNKPKDEIVSIVLSNENFVNLHTMVHNRCETQNLIPIVNR